MVSVLPVFHKTKFRNPFSLEGIANRIGEEICKLTLLPRARDLKFPHEPNPTCKLFSASGEAAGGTNGCEGGVGEGGGNVTCARATPTLVAELRPTAFLDQLLQEQPHLDVPARTAVQPDMVGDVDLNRLHGREVKERHQERKFEKPWHRHAAWMSARMATPQEIADFCDVAVTSVRDLQRNAWFQQIVIELMARSGQRDIMELFKAEQFNSFNVLVELRDSPKTPPPVRAKVALDILQQVLGKPTQRIETEVSQPSADPVAEVERLRSENESLASRHGVQSAPSGEAGGNP